MEDQEEEKSLLYVCAGKCGKDLSKEEFTSSQWAKGATHRKCIHCTGGAPRVAGEPDCARPMCYRERLPSHPTLCAACAANAECEATCGEHAGPHSPKCKSIQILRTMKQQLNRLIGHAQADLALFTSAEDYHKFEDDLGMMCHITGSWCSTRLAGPYVLRSMAGEQLMRRFPDYGLGVEPLPDHVDPRWYDEHAPDPPPCECVAGVCKSLSTPSLAKGGMMLCEFCGPNPLPCGCCDCQNCVCSDNEDTGYNH